LDAVTQAEKLTQHEIFVNRVKIALSWYNACAGAVSRDDMDSAIRSIKKSLEELKEKVS
jgi:hypothetical protein